MGEVLVEFIEFVGEFDEGLMGVLSVEGGKVDGVEEEFV